MEPEIIFLGTGGDSAVVGRSHRAGGGIIVRTSDNQIHIDPGPGSTVMAKACGVNLRENTCVLVTHAHTNHCNDINAVIDAMTLSGLDVKGVVVGNQSVIQGDEKMPAYITPKHKEYVEKFLSLKPGQKVAIEQTEVQALPAYHSDEHALGFKLFTPHFILSYSGDTKYNKELLDAYKGSDILVLNVVYPFESDKKDQLNTKDAIKIINAIKPSLAIITHFGKQMMQADPMQEARIIQRETNIQIVAAKDGIVLNPGSYSAELQQKTLNLYRPKG